jgi:hypothetical protein
MGFSADAFMGLILGLMFFALGVATITVANKGQSVPSFGTDRNGEPVTTKIVIKDYINITFGSVFLVQGVVIFVMAVRAAMS